MPDPFVDPRQGDADIPKRVDITRGGASTGHIARSGRIALCEMGRVGHEQPSNHNWGWMRIIRRDLQEMSLMSDFFTGRVLSIPRRSGRFSDGSKAATLSGI